MTSWRTCTRETSVKTTVAKINPRSISRAAALLRAGQVVAFPTETVYGLGANALNGGAVKKIFAAKGRPQDNPVLVHIADEKMLQMLVRKIPPRAQKLISHFWPGPLTLVLEARPAVPRVVTAGLPTVAVRMPAHKAALGLIRQAGVPIAAPSANTSGKPSPTRADHVAQDLRGKIPLILDGGSSQHGVESTIVAFPRGKAIMLRPGAIPREAIERIIGPVRLATAKSKVQAPGMKYRHYAPRALLVLTKGNPQIVRAEYTARKVKVFPAGTLSLKNLYASLRAADAKGFEVVIAQAVPEKGEGLALMNRLRKAASRVC